ncbi:5-oxoprolinase subunit PxpA [Alkalibacillus silvisoli]|uniref:5-oxoprolinase subunit A n=1 Tax=Alkalibacillus silvisoli TaxID=392823 RepID=A0ABN0ZL51_9BACI
MRIDLNADLAEGFGHYDMGEDESLMTVISSANVACGFHAGDYRTIPKAIKQAKRAKVAIGAHPGYFDLFGFGRREMNLAPEEIYDLLIYQLGAIKAFCDVEDVPLSHVKPHGALYNQAAKEEQVAKAIVQAVKDVDHNLVLFGLANSLLVEVGHQLDLNVASEVFADRTYTKEGFLTPRKDAKAVITDYEEIERQVFNFVFHGYVETITGERVFIEADTLCFHGDGKSVFRHANRIRTKLEQEGVQVKAITS